MFSCDNHAKVKCEWLDLKKTGDGKRKEVSRDLFRRIDMERKINEFDRVRIISNGSTGTVVDIFQIKGEPIYIIEEDKMTLNEKGEMDYKFYQCKGDELEVI